MLITLKRSQILVVFIICMYSEIWKLIITTFKSIDSQLKSEEVFSPINSINAWKLLPFDDQKKLPVISICILVAACLKYSEICKHWANYWTFWPIFTTPDLLLIYFVYSSVLIYRTSVFFISSYGTALAQRALTLC